MASPTSAITSNFHAQNPQNFETYAGYQEVIQTLIADTKKTLRILDTDLNDSGLETLQNVALLQHLAQNSQYENAIRILVRTPRYLEQHGARLLRFLAYFGHRACLRILPAENTPIPESVFFIADDRHLIRRLIPSRPNGRYWRDAPAIASANIVQFDSLWVISQPGLQGTTLGL